MSLSAVTVTSAVASMFADYYRLDQEEAAVGVGGADSGSVFWGAASGRCLGMGVDSRGGPDRRRQRTAEPTTNPPATPGSMSSEHSFMATSAPAPQPPALAAHPGLPPYVPAGASAGASVDEGAALTSSRNTNAQPHSQTPGHPSFRRQRASRACESKSRFFYRLPLWARRLPARRWHCASEQRAEAIEEPRHRASSITITVHNANNTQPATPAK